ncbi:hypothetical protein EDB19DRAFT_1836684 [Suillus lakei]|nr:hypothetical protein EDB19DRAFT_1836684 [Suillus lakei]
MCFATSTWSAANAQKPLPGSDIKCKPDLVLSDDVLAKWGNIRVSAELMHSQYQPVMQLGKAADTHAYLMMSEQLWRIVSPPQPKDICGYHPIRNAPAQWSTMDYAIAASTSNSLPFPENPNEVSSSDAFESVVFNNSDESSSNSAHNSTKESLSSSAITICYLVTLDDEDYIIKDHWVLGKDNQVVLNEIKMLELMDNIPGVPKLVDYLVVEWSDGESNITQKYWQKKCWSTRGTSYTHVCLILKPCGCPLHMFQMLKEFMWALRDIVKNNLGSSEGFLIDWEFVVYITADHKYPIGGTGTVPFMSCGLLNQVMILQQQANLESQMKKGTQGHKSAEKLKNPKSSSNSLALLISYVVQGYMDDLESLFIVFAWV